MLENPWFERDDGAVFIELNLSRGGAAFRNVAATTGYIYGTLFTDGIVYYAADNVTPLGIEIGAQFDMPYALIRAQATSGAYQIQLIIITVETSNGAFLTISGWSDFRQQFEMEDIMWQIIETAEVICYVDCFEGYIIPAYVNHEHIEEVANIQTQLADGEITEDEAQTRLDAIVSEIGAGGLAWIVRNIPVYDTERGEWLSFNSYAIELGQESGVPEDSRLAQDPVGVGVDLFLGNYDPAEVLVGHLLWG